MDGYNKVFLRVSGYYSSCLLTTNGVLLFDDSANPHVRKVLRFIDRNLHGSFGKLDLGKYRSGRIERLKYQVASFLGRNQLTVYQKVGPAERDWRSRLRAF